MRWSIFWYISKTARILTRQYTEALFPLGLNSAQANVLIALSELEEQSEHPIQNELAHKLVLDKVSLHQLLRKLEQLEYVVLKKSEADQRCKLVSLSIKGRYLIPRIKMVQENVSAYFEKQFLMQDLDELKESLNKFIIDHSRQ